MLKKGLRLGAVLAMIGVYVLPAAPAHAAPLWSSDGNGPYNFRLSGNGPYASRTDELTQVWRRTLDGDVTGTPVLDDKGYLYVGTHGANVAALARENGFVLWSRFVGGAVVGSPLLHNDTLYAVASRTGSPRLVALDPTAGAIKWSTIIDTQPNSDAWASPNISVANNLIYVATCACSAVKAKKSGITTRGSVTAVNATTGDIAWKTYMVPGGFNGAGIAGTPMVVDGFNRLYVATDHAFSGAAHERTDAIVSLDTTNGQILGSWQATADDVAEANQTTQLGKRVGFTTAVNLVQKLTDGTYPVTAGAGDGYVYAVSSLTMQPLWKTRVAAGYSDGGVVGSAAWDGTLLHGTASLPGFNWGLTNTGATGYTFPAVDTQRMGPASTSRGVVYATSTLGYVQAWDAKTGRFYGQAGLGGPSIGGVALAAGKVFAAVGTGNNTGGGVAAFR